MSLAVTMEIPLAEIFAVWGSSVFILNLTFSNSKEWL